MPPNSPDSSESANARRKVSGKRSRSRGNKARRAHRREIRAMERAKLIDEIDGLATERMEARSRGDHGRVRALTIELNGKIAAVEDKDPFAQDLSGDDAYLRERNEGLYANLRADFPDQGSEFRRPTAEMGSSSQKPRGLRKHGKGVKSTNALYRMIESVYRALPPPSVPAREWKTYPRASKVSTSNEGSER